MTQSEKERVQYLLTQLLEGGSTQGEKQLLFTFLDKEEDNAEWESILEELIASESLQRNYDREKWNVVAQNILKTSRERSNEDEPSTKVVALPGRNRWIWMASVAAMLIIAVSLWFITTRDGKSTIQTEYAQQKKIALPDETEIILNSNSNITYLKHWENGQPREVWLKGEALFKVKHINTDTNSVSAQERFIVHTALAKIEVLGTVFNVRERRGRIEIVLEQGKIKVSFNNGEPDIIMKPGQMVTLTAANEKVLVNTIKPAEYTSWTKKKLILTDASFQQIVEYMEDNFGKRIILTDPALANRRVEGTFKMDNMDDALLVLSKALNVAITQKGDTLIFTPQ